MKAAGKITGEHILLLPNKIFSRNSNPLVKEGWNSFHTGKIRSFFSHLPLIFTLTLILSACASRDDVGRVQYSLYDLKKEVQELKKRSQTMEKEIPESRKHLDRQLEGTKDSQDVTARAVSNLFIKVEDLTGEIQQMTGRIEESQHFYEKHLEDEAEKRDMLAVEMDGLKNLLKETKIKLEETKIKLEEMKLKLEETRLKLEDMNTRVDDIKSEQEFLSSKVGNIESRRIPPPKKTSKKAVVQKSGALAEEAAVKDIYNDAYALYELGKYSEAREKFMSVLQDYKENEYSDNARFWIGGCYFKEKKYEDAIIAYEDLFKKNPDSDKIPAAKLKQGLAFYEVGDPETGEYILRSLIELFPDSKDAGLARKKLGIASTI